MPSQCQDMAEGRGIRGGLWRFTSPESEVYAVIKGLLAFGWKMWMPVKDRHPRVWIVKDYFTPISLAQVSATTALAADCSSSDGKIALA